MRCLKNVVCFCVGALVVDELITNVLKYRNYNRLLEYKKAKHTILSLAQVGVQTTTENNVESK